MGKTISLFILLFNMALRLTAMNSWEYYFDKPASVWEESIPLGNGRIGMMPWGGVERERIVLNEISLWAGNIQDADNPDAYRHLGEIRRLLFEGKNKAAQDLMYRTFTCKGNGSADNGSYGNFQNFGNIYIDFIYPDGGFAENYRRALNLNDAISTVSFRKSGIDYYREYFTSFGDDIGYAKFSSSQRQSLNMKISLQRDERFEVKTKDNTICIFGQMLDNVKNNGMKYYGVVRVIQRGGNLETFNDYLEIKNADSVELIISLATDYDGISANEKAKNKSILKNNDLKNIKKRHSENYQSLFNRVDLTLEKNNHSYLPIDKRLDAFYYDNTDYDLAALYMQYGRYLLISSTRPDGLPPNLQGLWAPQIHTPWNGDYHLNINLQMNLWPAEICNLSELQLPLVDYVKSLVEPGEKTARIYYSSKGWVTHILGNVWGFTSPSEDPSWGATNTAGAWLCQHLWEHFLYTRDMEYLKSVYPTMKGAAEFFSDMLVEDPRSNYVVTAPTTSPENQYIDFNGDTVSICAGSTMDNQIVRELFNNVISASRLLNIDVDFAKELTAKKEKLFPTSIGKYGQVMEWLEDYEEQDVHHRHVSQLYGLFPGYELTYEKTPELMEAAKTTLNRRGDESTGWSMAWKICFWARLKDGDRAYKLLGDLLKPAGSGWGTYPNLFSAHPPMQIDGNFGGAAGIAEMLVQSHSDYIELLPAIPKNWRKGEAKGLKVRNGGEISFKWDNGKIQQIEFKATSENEFIFNIPTENFRLKGIKNYRVENGKLFAEMKANESFRIFFLY